MRRANANNESRKNLLNSLAIGIGLAALVLQLSACSSVAYYSQSVIGHSKLMLARQPLDKALAAAIAANDQALTQQLQLAKQLRTFAVSELQLPANGSYLSYVNLEREFPVWTVVAAAEFSVMPRQWCYLVIGCASYRGYFSKQAAHSYAAGLQDQGWDVTVGGAPAYSTLGWFDDPLLPSMMRYGTAEFAETLFHELAHQVLYIKGDSEINEAFATTVGEQGTLQWLQQHRPHLLPRYEARRAALYDFNNLLLATRAALENVFQSNLSSRIKRQQKAAIFAQLKVDYDALDHSQWGDAGWFDAWFETPVNNARLAALATYRDQVPTFDQLLGACGYDFQLFYRTLEIATAAKRVELQIPIECIGK